MQIIDGKIIFSSPEEEREYNASTTYNFQKINNYIINNECPTKEGSDHTIDDVINELMKIKNDPNMVVNSVLCNISYLDLNKLKEGNKDE